MKTMIPNHVFIMIDFDGTITTEQDDNFGEYTLRPNVKEVLERLHSTGRVHFGLWTCRTGNQIDTAITFLAETGLFHYFDVVNNCFTEIVAIFGENRIPRKVSADIYFDDRALLHEVDWLEFEKYINAILEEQDHEETYSGL